MERICSAPLDLVCNDLSRARLRTVAKRLQSAHGGDYAMEGSTLIGLFTDHLRGVYDAEKQLTKALPRMAKAASDKELAQGFREHAAQTQAQARRLEQVFQMLGMKARGKPCTGIKGLIEEGQEIIRRED